MSRELMIFSGNANLALAHEICAYLGAKLGEATVSSFSDGEIRVKIEENVRGADVYVVQSTCSPVNDSLMELLIIIDALKRSSAYRITAVIPYFGYARQDRKDQPRVPITAKLIADLITTAGVGVRRLEPATFICCALLRKPTKRLNSNGNQGRLTTECGFLGRIL